MSPYVTGIFVDCFSASASTDVIYNMYVDDKAAKLFSASQLFVVVSLLLSTVVFFFSIFGSVVASFDKNSI